MAGSRKELKEQEPKLWEKHTRAKENHMTFFIREFADLGSRDGILNFVILTPPQVAS
jgi:hypothetical protein